MNKKAILGNLMVPEFFSWAGLFTGTYHFVFLSREGIFTPCDHVWILIIPLGLVLFNRSLISKLGHFSFPVLFLIAAGTVLIMSLKEVAPLGLAASGLAFLPGLSSRMVPKLWGIATGLGICWLGFGNGLGLEISGIMLVVFGVILAWLKKNKNGLGAGYGVESIEFPRVKNLTGLFKSIVDATVILLLLCLPMYASHYVFAGVLLALINFQVVNHFVSRKKNIYSIQVFLLISFISCFTLTLLLGLFSRSFGLSSIILLTAMGGLYALAVRPVEYLMAYPKVKDSKNSIFSGNTLQVSCIIGIIWLLVQFPACVFWNERIIEVSLPEPFLTLSLGQYWIKNVTLLLAFATILSGLVFLLRRRLF